MPEVTYKIKIRMETLLGVVWKENSNPINNHTEQTEDWKIKIGTNIQQAMAIVVKISLQQ
jgi:hypothetical protein